MTLFNTFALHAGRWSSGMTLALHGEFPWFDPHTLLRISVTFIADIVLHFFALFFTQWLIYPFSFHIDTLISIFMLHLANLCVVAKIEMHIKSVIFCTVFLREITKTKPVGLLQILVFFYYFFGKSTWERCLFLVFHWIIVYQGFYIWNLKRKYT